MATANRTDAAGFFAGARSGTLAAMDERVRCAWVGDDPIYVAYHDDEWGVPSQDERYVFEMLLLEGAQAGLNWRLILGKREGYRRAYDGFDPVRIAAWDDAKIESLAHDPATVRNRFKIRAARLLFPGLGWLYSHIPDTCPIGHCIRGISLLPA